MSVWAWPPIVFAAVLVAAALRRGRPGLAAAFLAYAAGTAWLSVVAWLPLRFAAPLIVLVAGYWLTGPFYTHHSARLEAWLMRFDDWMQVDRLAAAAPRWMRAVVEVAYAGCYPFMIVAAIPAFQHSASAYAWHWTLVLSAEFACYVTLPWLQARPPRENNGDGSHFYDSRKNETRPHFLRRFNESLLRNFSVRATTIPSGHVAGPLAASLSAWMIAPEYGPWLIAGAAIITAATVIGRYHYAIDAVLGALVGVVPPAIRSFWL